MSLKNIELQVALPRTVDNSRNQQILQHQTNLQNAMDSEQMKTRTEQAEQTVAETHQNERTEMRENQKRNKSGELSDQERLNEESEIQSAPHPFKGHKLDIKM